MTDILYANALVSARAAKYKLTREKMRSMISASSLNAAIGVLEECGYEIPEKSTPDKIIDNERTKTFKMFTDLCNDPALAEIITAKYNFANTSKDATTSYQSMEKKLFETISNLTPNIKNQNIRNFFHTELNAYNKGHKTPTEALYKLVAIGKDDLDTACPLFHWYFTKQAEFRCVKAILMGKQFDFTREIIFDNLQKLPELKFLLNGGVL